MNKLILCFTALAITLSANAHSDNDRKKHFRHYDNHYEKRHFKHYRKEHGYYKQHKRHTYYGDRLQRKPLYKHGYKHGHKHGLRHGHKHHYKHGYRGYYPRHYRHHTHRHRNYANDYWKIVGGTILLNEILHHSHSH